MTHRLTLRVYYEDTDLAGIVYYANYLKFIERGRTEWVRDLGIDQTRLKDEAGLVFAVRHLEADYLVPARFDDELIIETEPVRASGARIVVKQTVRREETILFAATVTLAVLTAEGRAGRLPAEYRQMLS